MIRTEKAGGLRGRLCRAFSALAALLLLFSSCGSGAGSATAALSGKPALPAAAPAGKTAHTATALSAKSVPVAESGFLKLFLDEATMTVAIQENTPSATIWSTLGQSAQTPLANAGASAAEVTVILGNRRLTLNTQDHSVAFGRAKAERLLEDGRQIGVTVHYSLFPNAETAAKSAPAKSDVAFLLSVSYLLRDGNFYVSAAWENSSGNPDAFIESIGLLERFGALRSPSREDYLFLPDGSGALLYPARQAAQGTAAQRVESDALRFAVYGADASLPREAAPAGITDRDANGEVLRAQVAAFGVRRGSSSFLAVIDQGAALAHITALQNIPGELPQSAVGARFLITATTLPQSGGAAEGAVRARESYSGPLRICYRFFFGANANPSTMAIACREQLINSGFLSSTKTVEDERALLPLNLTVLGTAPEGKSGSTALSSFAQTYDLLTRLRGKGIDNINVRYMGALSGGWNPSAAEKLSPLLRLGGKAGLGELQSYCLSKGLDLFLDASLLSLEKAGKKLRALALDTAPLRRNPLEAYEAAAALLQKPEKASGGLRSLQELHVPVRDLLERLSPFATAGISLQDVGALLYSDYAASGVDRETAAKRLADCLPPLSAKWRVMLSVGNFSTVRKADVLTELPLEPALQMPTAGRYEGIPFLPILLHGSMDYSGASWNLSKNPEEALLRSVEYGASPAYTWYCTQTGTAADAALYFEPMLADAAAAYLRADAVLGDLRGERIMRHSKPVAGVSLTEFGSDAAVYVNYNNAAVTVNGITIPARDFLRVG
ncbi:MAG: DUF5696 domain-containing protein [Oscillospiraceae bacterium]|jgi:hypothetical protein|nr:DUF5696 domain-containing protein [Oscillospiraceae bacterium]